MSTWGRRGLSRSVRARILARDNGMCQLGYPGCSYFATKVDDIIPVSVLGVGREELTDDNRQSVCSSCHRVKTEAHRLAAVKAAAQRRHERRHLPYRRSTPARCDDAGDDDEHH